MTTNKQKIGFAIVVAVFILGFIFIAMNADYLALANGTLN